MRYKRGMTETPLPLAPEPWATLPAPVQASLQEQLATLRLENAALHAQNAMLQARIRGLEARLGRTSSKSFRPPSSDPPQALVCPKTPRSGCKRGGQPGHPGAGRALPPLEQGHGLNIATWQVGGRRPYASYPPHAARCIRWTYGVRGEDG